MRSWRLGFGAGSTPPAQTLATADYQVSSRCNSNRGKRHGQIAGRKSGDRHVGGRRRRARRREGAGRRRRADLRDGSKYLDGLPDPEAGMADIKAAHPLGRWAEPEEIADAIILPISPKGDLRDQMLMVDGGYSAR